MLHTVKPCIRKAGNTAHCPGQKNMQVYRLKLSWNAVWHITVVVIEKFHNYIQFPEQNKTGHVLFLHSS